MKTDTIFYRLFQSFPFIFFELIELPPTLTQLYRFSSVEVKQLAFRIDGVFLSETPDLPIYFVEVIGTLPMIGSACDDCLPQYNFKTILIFMRVFLPKSFYI